MEARGSWWYFWSTRNCYLVVFPEKLHQLQYPCEFPLICGLVVFHCGFD